MSSWNIFGSGPSPVLFKKPQNNAECCQDFGDAILTCADVMACISAGGGGAMLTAPNIPYWNGAAFVDSWLSRGALSTIMTSGTSFTSAAPGNSQFDFGPGDQFNFTTDGGGYAEAYFAMSPSGATMGFANEAVSVYPTSLNLLHSIEIHLDSPITRVQANGIIASFGAFLSQIDFGAAGNEINLTTDGGTFNEGNVALTPTSARIALGSEGFDVSALEATITHSILTRLQTPLVRMQANAIFASSAANKTEFNFGAGGDEFHLSTDGGTGNESGFDITPTQTLVYSPGAYLQLDATSGFYDAPTTNSFVVGGGTNGVLVDGSIGQVDIKAGTKAFFNTPYIEHIDTGTFDIDTPAGTYALFGTNASIVDYGRAGATMNVRSTLAMLSAQLQLAASAAGYASMTMPIGVAPAAPVNGDMWFDGTNLFMRIGGVSTIVV